MKAWIYNYSGKTSMLTIFHLFNFELVMCALINIVREWKKVPRQFWYHYDYMKVLALVIILTPALPKYCITVSLNRPICALTGCMALFCKDSHGLVTQIYIFAHIAGRIFVKTAWPATILFPLWVFQHAIRCYEITLACGHFPGCQLLSAVFAMVYLSCAAFRMLPGVYIF